MAKKDGIKGPLASGPKKGAKEGSRKGKHVKGATPTKGSY